MSTYYYAIGRRKESTAVIKLFPQWSGKFSVATENASKDKTLREYFGGNLHMYQQATMPFSVLGTDIDKKFDAQIVLRGGGISGQSGAIKLGFARALVEYNPELRATLKPYGLLERDARVKERKKPGLKKARKAPTWSKR